MWNSANKAEKASVENLFVDLFLIPSMSTLSTATTTKRKKRKIKQN